MISKKKRKKTFNYLFSYSLFNCPSSFSFFFLLLKLHEYCFFAVALDLNQRERDPEDRDCRLYSRMSEAEFEVIAAICGILSSSVIFITDMNWFLV